MDDEIAALLAEIGRLLPAESENPDAPCLLVAEVGDNYVGPAIFENLGTQLRWRSYDRSELTYALLDLWEAAPKEKRWAWIEYLLQNGQFKATFVYPEDISPDEEPFSRDWTTAERYFPGIPIVYPPWKDDVSDFTI